MLAIGYEGISKEFDGVPMLWFPDVSFRMSGVNGRAGGNGAGKSTLFKIISGQFQPDAGVLTIFGACVRRCDATSSQQLGISIVPQKFLPVLGMRAWQNLFVGRELHGPFGVRLRKNSTSGNDAFQ